ncbi:SDR family NAD(P)-dependent oxidoreductase [Paracoccus caeni]|uniref:SDR family NAD(P)-dependent oxidoreductase n=1 Tax=Paracoccus caeni TaxID=657651 RepID=A0A934SDX8_9RHOB|nr:SDR family NAD(P)-dependent oxidoreductase [Paracoccus caeni]MBK4215171.1 SDR family NAD(P)-dependent oxidoreductase [Paracoccus caeni]
MNVLITGTSRGIGAALADAYRAGGAHVLAAARHPTGDQVAFDVQSEADFEALAKRLSGMSLDLLVCNAGIYNDKSLSIDALEPQIWAEAFAVNVTGAFLTVRACLPALRRGAGKIALISSAMGSDARAPGGSYVYRASKAALLNLGRNLATDLDLPVGIYHPGWVQTQMGGAGAQITVAQSVEGLLNRFEALDAASSGQFLNYDGTPIPF